MSDAEKNRSHNSLMGRYLIATICMSFGLILLYFFFHGITTIVQNGKGEAIIYYFVMLLGSIFIIIIGMTGFLLRPNQQVRIIGNKFIIPNQWRFIKKEKCIDFADILIVYSNLKNKFPALFIIWLDRQHENRGNLTYLEKSDIPDFEATILNLSKKLKIDVENRAYAALAIKYVKQQYGLDI